MGDDTDYIPTSLLPHEISHAKLVDELNQLRETLAQARASRHKHQTHVAGIVTAIQGEMVASQKSYADDIHRVYQRLDALTMALTGGEFGAHGLVSQVGNLASQVGSISVQVASQSVQIHELTTDMRERHLATASARAAELLKSSLRPAKTSQSSRELWYKHPIVMSIAGAVALSALVKAAPWIGDVLANVK